MSHAKLRSRGYAFHLAHRFSITSIVLITNCEEIAFYSIFSEEIASIVEKRHFSNDRNVLDTFIKILINLEEKFFTLATVLCILFSKKLKTVKKLLRYAVYVARNIRNYYLCHTNMFHSK